MIDIYSIKFFVLQDGDVINGFQSDDDAKQFCRDMKKAYPRHTYTIFSVDSVTDDDKELERIREHFFYQMQAREEDWDR